MSGKQPDDIKKILILGGYGRAGKQVAQKLADLGKYEIIIAGRTLSKAENYTRELRTKYPDSCFRPEKIDVTQKELLAEVFINVHLVIVCTSLNYKITCGLIEAILKSKQAHYIDLSPADEKYQAFIDHKDKIKQQDHTFILDAGFEPGLPGFLANYLLAQMKSPTDLLIEGIYRDPEIPAGGIQDILNHDGQAKIYTSGTWQNVSIFNTKVIDFPWGYGRALSMPLWSAELADIPQKFNLQDLAYYHAGINSVAHMVMFAWQKMLKKFLPLSTGISIYQWAIKNFTQKPYGGTIRAVAKNGYLQKKVVVSHDKLYEATAIPVVASTLLLLENSLNDHGYYFMGEWVDQEFFLKKLKTLGMNISVN